MEITTDRQSDIIRKVELIQRKIFSGPKSEVSIFRDRLNIACPYCLDSDNKYKKRGNLYWKTLQYHCYNGGCSKKHTTLVSFMRDFDQPIKNIKDLSFFLEYIEYNRVNIESKDYLQYEVFSNLNEYSITIQELKAKFNLIHPKENKRCLAYLKGRLLHKNLNNFLFSQEQNQLYILNLNSAGNVLGYQIRNFSQYRQKYISYTIEKINILVKNRNIELESAQISKINTLSLYFGIMFADFTRPVTIFEGPIDSLLLGNSIALSGADKPTQMFDEIPTVRYLFDNDSIGRKIMEKKLRCKKNVFMWGKLVRDYKIRKKIKDFNELIIYCWKNQNDALRNINEYFTDEPIDIRLI